MNNIIVAPSILAADFRNLERAFENINKSTAEWVHFDVMDGQFVPNISFGFPLLEACRSLTGKFIDVHLMMNNPSLYFEEFKRFGADGLTIHYEGNNRLNEDLSQIRKLGMKAGLVINPDTSVESITPYIDTVDLILIMAVHPGFGGQKFIEETVEKVSIAKQIIGDRPVKLEVDGGVTVENAKRLINAGANVLVSGSALFRAEHFIEYVEKLKS